MCGSSLLIYISLPQTCGGVRLHTTGVLLVANRPEHLDPTGLYNGKGGRRLERALFDTLSYWLFLYLFRLGQQRDEPAVHRLWLQYQPPMFTRPKLQVYTSKGNYKVTESSRFTKQKSTRDETPCLSEYCSAGRRAAVLCHSGGDSASLASHSAQQLHPFDAVCLQ